MELVDEIIAIEKELVTAKNNAVAGYTIVAKTCLNLAALMIENVIAPPQKAPYQMVEYQKKINQLRMLRSDLDEKTIVNAVKRIKFSNPPRTVLSVLDGWIQDAKQDIHFDLETDKN